MMGTDGWPIEFLEQIQRIGKWPMAGHLTHLATAKGFSTAEALAMRMLGSLTTELGLRRRRSALAPRWCRCTVICTFWYPEESAKIRHLVYTRMLVKERLFHDGTVGN